MNLELANQTYSISSKELKERVEQARIIQREKYKDITRINCNAQMSSALIKELLAVPDNIYSRQSLGSNVWCEWSDNYYY